MITIIIVTISLVTLFSSTLGAAMAIQHRRTVRLPLLHDPVNTYRLEHEIYTDIYDEDYILAMHHKKDDCPFCPQIISKHQADIPSHRNRLTPRHNDMTRKAIREAFKQKQANPKLVVMPEHRWDTASRPEFQYNPTLDTIDVKRPPQVPAGADAEVIRGDGQVIHVIWTWYDVSKGGKYRYAQPLALPPSTYVKKVEQV